MKVVILCGGQGVRIREVNELLPKPMIPIGSMPIVWHIMRGYAHYGFKDFVLCLGYKGWVIKEYFLNYRAIRCDVRVSLGQPGGVEVLGGHDEDWTVTLADTGEGAMTGGRIAAVRRYVESDDLFMVTYGDGVGNVDLARLVDFHRAHGKIATVTAVRPMGRFGELRIGGGLVREFNEKPQATEGFINGGFFVCDARRIWDYVDPSPSTVWELEPMQRLAVAGELAAFEHHGYWQPMDTMREYTLLNDLWNRGAAPWNVWDRAGA